MADLAGPTFLFTFPGALFLRRKLALPFRGDQALVALLPQL